MCSYIFFLQRSKLVGMNGLQNVTVLSSSCRLLKDSSVTKFQSLVNALEFETNIYLPPYQFEWFWIWNTCSYSSVKFVCNFEAFVILCSGIFRVLVCVLCVVYLVWLWCLEGGGMHVHVCVCVFRVHACKASWKMKYPGLSLRVQRYVYILISGDTTFLDFLLIMNVLTYIPSYSLMLHIAQICMTLFHIAL